MAAAEAIQSGWQNPSDANEASEMLEQLQKFGERLVPIQRNIEDTNDQASVFASSSVIVSHALLAKLEDLNSRYIIHTYVQITRRLIDFAPLHSFGQSIERDSLIFLCKSFLMKKVPFKSS